MTSIDDIDRFLSEFKRKMGIWDVLFLNREKNLQALSDLEITPGARKKILTELEYVDYSQGPLTDTMLNGAEMWVFGKKIKGREVYIKVTMGMLGSSVVCISFHLAERPMNYPLK